MTRDMSTRYLRDRNETSIATHRYLLAGWVNDVSTGDELVVGCHTGTQREGPVAKPAKPRSRVLQSVTVAGVAATIATGFATWEALHGDWPRVAHTLVVGTCMVVWFGVIALAVARHVTRYNRMLAVWQDHRESQRIARLERTIRRGSIIDTAESILRGN